MMRRAFVVALALLLGVAARAKADTISVPGGADGIGWGPTNQVSVGETFTVPGTDTLLTDYTLIMKDTGTAFPFVSQIYLWNPGTHSPTGVALYTSSTQTMTSTYTTYTFTPGLTVTPGQQYVALVTNSPGGSSLGSPVGAQGVIDYNSTNPYSGGSYVTGGSLLQPDPATASNWQVQPGFDAAFTADLAGPAVATPEPSSLVLLGTASVIAAGCFGRRRRKPQ